MNRDRLLRRCAILAVALGAAAALGWALGFDGGVLFPVAIGLATAVAIAGGTGGKCAPRSARRPE